MNLLVRVKDLAKIVRSKVKVLNEWQTKNDLTQTNKQRIMNVGVYGF